MNNTLETPATEIAADNRPRTGGECPECGADMIHTDEYMTACVACDYFHNAEPDWDFMRGGHDYDPSGDHDPGDDHDYGPGDD